jgi:hypothetical protein
VAPGACCATSDVIHARTAEADLVRGEKPSRVLEGSLDHDSRGSPVSTGGLVRSRAGEGFEREDKQKPETPTVCFSPSYGVTGLETTKPIVIFTAVTIQALDFPT